MDQDTNDRPGTTKDRPDPGGQAMVEAVRELDRLFLAGDQGAYRARLKQFYENEGRPLGMTPPMRERKDR